MASDAIHMSSVLSGQGRVSGELCDLAGGRPMIGQQVRNAIPLPHQLILACQDLLSQPVINGKIIADVVHAIALRHNGVYSQKNFI